MTRQFQVYLDRDDSAVTYSCVHCRAHLADYRDLISKSFQGSQGRAYLFDKIVNVKSAAAEDRLLLTGHHRVADIHCICCDTLLGWKYEKAFEPSQRYKEGKYIIELIHIIKENRWDVSLTPRAKRRSSGCSSERVDQSGAVSPLSQGGQQNGGFADSSTDLIEVVFPSNCVQGAAAAATAAAPCSSWPNPTLLSSAFTQPEESGLFHSDESPSAAVLLEQGQQGEHSEPGFIPHADLIPQLIQQSGSPPQDGGSDISHLRSSLGDLNICTTAGVAASPPSEHLTLFSPQRSPSKKSKKQKKHFRGAVASVGSHPRLASSSSTCTLTEPLLDAEPEMATSFLSSVVDDSTDPSQPSSGRPSGSHQLILPPSESALTLLTEVASPSDALLDSKKEPHEEAFSALDW